MIQGPIDVSDIEKTLLQQLDQRYLNLYLQKFQFLGACYELKSNKIFNLREAISLLLTIQRRLYSDGNKTVFYDRSYFSAITSHPLDWAEKHQF